MSSSVIRFIVIASVISLTTAHNQFASGGVWSVFHKFLETNHTLTGGSENRGGERKGNERRAALRKAEDVPGSREAAAKPPGMTAAAGQLKPFAFLCWWVNV